MADYQLSLDTIQKLLQDPLAFSAGKPQFKSVPEMNAYLRGKGFRLTDNTAFGPQDPDARQLIYQGPNNVIVKIKTCGYQQGPRMGRATLSVEATDGKGTGWDNTLFKADGNG